MWLGCCIFEMRPTPEHTSSRAVVTTTVVSRRRSSEKHQNERGRINEWEGWEGQQTNAMKPAFIHESFVFIPFVLVFVCFPTSYFPRHTAPSMRPPAFFVVSFHQSSFPPSPYSASFYIFKSTLLPKRRLSIYCYSHFRFISLPFPSSTLAPLLIQARA